uniref:Uncharacterized protein n=1 Tax=Mola mola TaxID=94237 RepID=A0A3Q3WG35_MOLML
MPVTNQPTAYQPSDFQTSMFDCCDDCGTCWYAMMCLPCIGCSIASDMDECCLCGLGMSIRSVYRAKYNIRGSLCQDFLATSCFRCCAVCQLKRDIDRRKSQGIF